VQQWLAPPPPARSISDADDRKRRTQTAPAAHREEPREMDTTEGLEGLKERVGRRPQIAKPKNTKSTMLARKGMMLWMPCPLLSKASMTPYCRASEKKVGG